MGAAPRRTDDETAEPVITIKGSLKTGYKRFQAAFCYSETLAKALGVLQVGHGCPTFLVVAY